MADCLEDASTLDGDRLIDNISFQKNQVDIFKHDFREFGAPMPEPNADKTQFNSDDISALLEGVKGQGISIGELNSSKIADESNARDCHKTTTARMGCGTTGDIEDF